MPARNPRSSLATHDVTNQPPPFGEVNFFDRDPALKEALPREGAAWAEERAWELGAIAGSEETLELGRLANRHPPELRSFDRYGRRIDEVAFHPAYHALMKIGMAHALPSIAWTSPQKGGHVAHAVLEYLLYQAEAGVCCPLTMTYAAVPALRHQPEIAQTWEPRLTARDYDPRSLPAAEKTSATIGMAMTEKQGGSDVRANTTKARALDQGGPGQEYELTGHKWFCSAPMSDAFLTLAYSDGGLSCFLVPRWHPDGSRNAIQIQRLKDKMGNRSNASSEIEYHGAWAQMVGEEGRGVPTIIEMVQHTRLDAALAPAALMRQGTVQAIHHCRGRSVFQRRLADQPLMQNVLADLALESEAAMAMILRVARGFDDGAGDPEAAAFARIAVALAKYWLNKRAAPHLAEAMECLGGAGYVEESDLPRLYREVPVNSIWEGSGNVICLDILRATQKEPAALPAFLQEVGRAKGADSRLDRWIDRLTESLGNPENLEGRARRLAERMALALQAALLVQHAPPAVADAFCASRLAGSPNSCFGTLPAGLAAQEIIERAWPARD